LSIKFSFTFTILCHMRIMSLVNHVLFVWIIKLLQIFKANRSFFNYTKWSKRIEIISILQIYLIKNFQWLISIWIFIKLFSYVAIFIAHTYIPSSWLYKSFHLSNKSLTKGNFHLNYFFILQQPPQQDEKFFIYFWGRLQITSDFSRGGDSGAVWLNPCFIWSLEFLCQMGYKNPNFFDRRHL